jgi:hypothetical protein
MGCRICVELDRRKWRLVLAPMLEPHIIYAGLLVFLDRIRQKTASKKRRGNLLAAFLRHQPKSNSIARTRRAQFDAATIKMEVRS